ncbi:MAG TPA: hypothetical protein VMT53_02395 [Terriglobales bacterium]|nr:hypothetical protein [Terriglobales bacterium]
MLLVAGFAWVEVELCVLLWVLELELGEVAWFEELGLGVVSLCAQAPNTAAKMKGNANESSRFIVDASDHRFAYAGSMVWARGAVFLAVEDSQAR